MFHRFRSQGSYLGLEVGMHNTAEGEDLLRSTLDDDIVRALWHTCRHLSLFLLLVRAISTICSLAIGDSVRSFKPRLGRVHFQLECLLWILNPSEEDTPTFPSSHLVSQMVDLISTPMRFCIRHKGRKCHRVFISCHHISAHFLASTFYGLKNGLS